MKPDQIVTRFAPSPTGYLHLGGARTALFNWLYARANGGKFILRIEDTDLERSTDESTQVILDSLKWLNIDWDGEEFYQSKRLDLYRQKLKEMADKGAIYPAFETREELDAAREEAQKDGGSYKYNRAALKLSAEEREAKIESGEAHVWRFKIPDEGHTEVPELLLGNKETKFMHKDMDDFIITRPGTKDNPGMPLYNLVCAIDDADMGITHVIRGVEHFTNAAKQVLLHQALGNDVPNFVHIPLIMKNGKKMSKRDADPDGLTPVSIDGRKELGYLPQATINHLALLGWSHPDEEEILSISDLKQTFDIGRINKANANFDEAKYLHFNAHYINEMDNEALTALIQPFLNGIDLNSEKNASQAIELEKPRAKTLKELAENMGYLFAPQAPNAEDKDRVLGNLDGQESVILTKTADMIESLDPFSIETLESSLKEVVEALSIKFKHFGPLIRLALCGRTNAPGLADIIFVLGRDESVKRLKSFK